MSTATQAKSLPPTELPKFLEEAQAKQRNLPPPPSPAARRSVQQATFVDDPSAVPFHVRMTDYLWPSIFWVMMFYNTAVMAIAVWNIATEGFSAWIHFQAGIITVSTTGMIAIIVKWILNAPDGVPSWRPRQAAKGDDNH